jgi:hypothetical protein
MAVPRSQPTDPPSDGHPSDSVHYREYKLILRPDRFTSPEALREFGKLVRATAKKEGVSVTRPASSVGEHLREVVFFDTPRFDLYESAFILRQRAAHQDGWPVGDSELTLKFRHPEVDAAARIDVRPATEHEFRVKFKEELLPPRGRGEGMRSLYSHNVVLTMPPQHLSEDVARAARVFPALRTLLNSTGPLEVVQRARITEVLEDIGVLDFGHGLTAKANVALWRTGVVGPSLVGELAYQCKFERDQDVHVKARKRADALYLGLQTAVRDWLARGVTKTGVVYGLGKTVPRHHE